MSVCSGGAPRYAVVTLPPLTDTHALHRLLSDHGLREVAFVDRCVYGEDASRLLGKVSDLFDSLKEEPREKTTSSPDEMNHLIVEDEEEMMPIQSATAIISERPLRVLSPLEPLTIPLPALSIRSANGRTALEREAEIQSLLCPPSILGPPSSPLTKSENHEKLRQLASEGKIRLFKETISVRSLDGSVLGRSETEASASQQANIAHVLHLLQQQESPSSPLTLADTLRQTAAAPRKNTRKPANAIVPVEKCRECGVETQCLQASMLRHSIKHSLLPPRFRCRLCPFAKNRADVVRAHIRAEHAGEPVFQSVADTITPERQEKDMELLAHCFPVFAATAFQGTSIEDMLSGESAVPSPPTDEEPRCKSARLEARVKEEEPEGEEKAEDAVTHNVHAIIRDARRRESTRSNRRHN